MMKHLDNIDQQIINLLKEDGRMPFTAMASALGIAESTVRKRVNDMIEAGVLKITAIVDPRVLGKSTSAIVGLQIEGSKVENIIEKLNECKQVTLIAVCAGVYDLIIKISVSSTEELYDFLSNELRKIDGITSSETSLVMKMRKEVYPHSLG
jgi:Lrp/AsnC family transcriptional regulator for asnA, asnC and gidA